MITGFKPKRENTIFQVCRVWLVISICAVSFSLAEEACKFEYIGQPHKLNNTTIVLPEEVVAMSEYVRVGNPIDLIDIGQPVSIMFVVDVSSSNIGLQAGTDHDGIRFEVLRDVLDSIYNRDPKVMVGLIYLSSELYFKPDDDPLFSKVTGGKYEGGYIPLLSLDETYKGTFTETNGSGGIVSQTPYEKTGIEVLQMYAQTNQTNVGAKPEYEPSYEILIGLWTPDFPGAAPLTNITASFDAVKDALSKSPHPKNKRYTIFFSDGEANIPDNDDAERDRYIQGIDVPTTFTLFYNSKPNELLKLQTMTQNIKTNGYSTSNPMSNIWDLKMDYDALLKLLIDNVISLIITNITTFETQTVEVNGLGPISGWDSTGFFFENFFPLTGKETDFHYAIDYKVTKDSVTEEGDTVTVSIIDTTHEIDFTVEIEDDAPVPDSIELTCWGRRLEFYYDGSKIDYVDGSMEELEIRFTEYEVDTLYNYDTVPVEITHTEGGTIDVENFMLEDQADYWSYTFSRVMSNPNPGDGILQHQNSDSIVAIFRNTFLPLDTLRIAIPFYSDIAYTIKEGIYFDNSANGHVDSVFIRVLGGKLEENVDAIMDNITLPAHRDFEIVNYSAVSGGIAIDVIEQASAILTYVTADDFIEITDTVILSEEVFIVPSKAYIIDSVAPVIMAASITHSIEENAPDELSVTFSEVVEAIIENQPFKYYSISNETVYDATLSVLSQSGNAGLFTVESVEVVSAIRDGDSIRINWIYDANVYDTLGNNQDNQQNIRREIVENGMRVRQGIYFDNNADGHIDSIFIVVSGKKVEEYVNDLMEVIELPSHREFEKGGYRYSTGGISVDVVENSDTIRTYVTDEDVIIIREGKILSDGEKILPSEADVIDSVAPIIMKATLRDSLKTSARDELIVEFSEVVGVITESRPFKYFSINDKIVYDADLSVILQNGDVGVFEVISLEGAESIQDGDSIRINWIFNMSVYDTIGNNQDNPDNIRREIDVKEIPDPYDLIVKATLLDPGKIYNLSDNIKNIPQIAEILKKVGVSGNNYQGIMIITLEPDSIHKATDNDSLAGVISIYDAVGNGVILKREMGYDKKGKKLVYIWDGRNEKGRHVGYGAYAAIIPADFFYKQEYKRSFVKKAIVGVKE